MTIKPQWMVSRRRAGNSGHSLASLGSCLLVLLNGYLFPPAEAHADDSDSPELARVKVQALAAERNGLPEDAARAYEQIASLAPTQQAAIARRLASLYAELKRPDDALRWARQAMVGNPEPQAYLAGIYAELGDSDRAIAILREEIARQAEPGRALITLHWQLAELYEQRGNTMEAERVLQNALELARGRPEEKATRTRLEQIQANGGGTP